MIKDDIYICDYCGKDSGEFDTETGNHPTCNEVAKLQGERDELRKCILRTSIEITNLIQNTPYKSIEDAVAFRSVACGMALRIHKDFAAVLGKES